jgi:hypothetical protein
MEPKEALNKLKESQVFNNWNPTHPCYLVHFLSELNNQLQPETWSIGFYNNKTDRITTFTLTDPIQVQPDSEVFKQEDTINELDITRITTTAAEAINAAKNIQKEHYQQHLPVKGLLVLQHLREPTWNITFITSTFAALNIKINATTNLTLEHNLTAFNDLRAK